MSDGREERDAEKARIEKERQENREDRIDPSDADYLEPERTDS
jgi:hypothetical protein